jgi:hypothetical protein
MPYLAPENAVAGESVEQHQREDEETRAPDRRKQSPHDGDDRPAQHCRAQARRARRQLRRLRQEENTGETIVLSAGSSSATFANASDAPECEGCNA